MDREHEVRYWTETFGVSRERLKEAVGNVGDSADKVREYLRSPAVTVVMAALIPGG
jgi:hypothetical protein